jgi:hypothetical protein
MPSVRIMAAAAAVLLFSGMATGGAAAQSATNQTPGKPLQLLKIVEQLTGPTIKPHVRSHTRSAARKTVHHAAAGREKSRPQVQTAMAVAPDNIWPTVNPIPPTQVAAAESAPIASASSDLAIGELVVSGQTVQVASPDDVNAIDLAANDAVTPAGAAAPSGTAASTQAANDTIQPVAKSDSLTTASATPQLADIGSASWIAQVLAALGGAFAAGSAAWFLMGSAPQRMYG